jgi:hypothetical protein
VIMVGATTVSILAMGASAAIFPAVVGIVTAWVAYSRSHFPPLAQRPRSVVAWSSRITSAVSYR